MIIIFNNYKNQIKKILFIKKLMMIILKKGLMKKKYS